MFYGDNVQDTRQLFFSSWEKYNRKQPLSPLEKQIVAVIIDHPEYHKLLEKQDAQRDQAYFPEMGETNPFLHLGLHLAIREQIDTNRPPGIRDIYDRLVIKYKDSLATEHLMINYLAECLWQAQRDNRMPDEAIYLQSLQELLI